MADQFWILGVYWLQIHCSPLRWAWIRCAARRSAGKSSFYPDSCGLLQPRWAFDVSEGCSVLCSCSCLVNEPIRHRVRAGLRVLLQGSAGPLHFSVLFVFRLFCVLVDCCAPVFMC